MRRRIREWRESPYRFIKSKEVRDDDGFITDYTWWYDERDGVYFFMFGDRDIYRPNRDYADWECDSYEEAEEWFWNYGTEEVVDDRFDEDYKRGLINYYKIIYGEGKPGEKEEIVKGEYRDVVRTAARRANGWGYDIVKMDVNESLKEDANEKMVIYTQMGEYCVTPKSNYGGRMQNSRKVHHMKDFESAREVMDYWNKYFHTTDDDFIIINESLKEDISDYEIDKVYKKLSKLNKVDFGALEDEYLETKPSVKDAVYKFYGTILNTKRYCKDFVQWAKEEKGIDLKGLPCKESLQRRINESPDEYGILYDSEVDNKYKEIASKEKDDNRKYKSRIIEYKRQILKRLPEIQEMINNSDGEYYSFNIDYNSATCHVNPNYIEIYTYIGRAPMIRFDLVVTKDGDIKGSADGGVGWAVSSRDISYAYSLFDEYFDTFKEEFYKKLSSEKEFYRRR